MNPRFCLTRKPLSWSFSIVISDPARPGPAWPGPTRSSIAVAPVKQIGTAANRPATAAKSVFSSPPQFFRGNLQVLSPRNQSNGSYSRVFRGRGEPSESAIVYSDSFFLRTLFFAGNSAQKRGRETALNQSKRIPYSDLGLAFWA